MGQRTAAPRRRRVLGEVLKRLFDDTQFGEYSSFGLPEFRGPSIRHRHSLCQTTCQ